MYKPGRENWSGEKVKRFCRQSFGTLVLGAGGRRKRGPRGGAGEEGAVKMDTYEDVEALVRSKAKLLGAPMYM